MQEEQSVQSTPLQLRSEAKLRNLKNENLYFILCANRKNGQLEKNMKHRYRQ